MACRMYVRRYAALAAAGCLLGGLGSAARAGQVLIDFGSSGTLTTTDTAGRTWTNITQANDVSGNPHTLTTTANTDSGWRLAVSNPPGVTNPVGFSGNNTNGTTTPNGTAGARNYPVSATSDNLYGHDQIFGTTEPVEAVRLTISNLNLAESYSFDFFSSRSATDNRETRFRVIGGGGFDQTRDLNASSNNGTIVGVSGVAPDANNQIVIDLSPGPNNNQAQGFYYLNVMEINSVPEPTGLAVLAGGAALLLGRRRRDGSKS